MRSLNQRIALGLLCRLRRVLAGLRQVDVALRCGITASRLSQIERGEIKASARDQEMLDRVLPPLNIAAEQQDRIRKFEADKDSQNEA